MQTGINDYYVAAYRNATQGHCSRSSRMEFAASNFYVTVEQASARIALTVQAD